MNNIIAFLIRESIDTMRNPREGARKVMAINATRLHRWQALVVVALLSAIFGYVSLYISTAISDVPVIDPTTVQPLMLAVAQFIGMLAMTLALYQVGRQFGGKGGLDDAILLVAWSQFLLVVVQVLQILVSIAMPVLAIVIGIAGIFRVIWVLLIFVSELHGFKSIPAIFVSVLAVAVVLALGLRFLFSLIGFNVMGII